MRFRYTTPSGDDVEVRDLDALREHVASGRLGDQTPLFDSMTGESGPASNHKAYRFVVDMFGVPLPGDEEGPEPSPSTDTLPDLGITLADSHEPESADEFVARLEKERASEEDAPPGTLRHLSTVGADPYNPMGTWDDLPEAEPSALERDGEAAPVEGPASDPLGAPPPSSRRAAAASRRREVQGDGSGSAASGRRSRLAGRAVLVAASLVLAGFLVPQLRSGLPELDAMPDGAGAEASVPPGPPPLDPRGIADRLAASEGIAFQHMVGGMDSLARAHRVFEVPEVWLEGAYLADAASHPGVEEYWERYLTFVDELRAQDATLFRRSFVGRMEGLGIAPSVLSLRLAQAVRRFEETQPKRDTMYMRMEDLARASLTLHDLMVARADRIQHTPMTHAAAVRDPFLQIYTEDTALQEEIYALLDRVFDNLEALHGETRWTRNELNDGVLEGLRSTGAPARAGSG